MNNEIRIMGNLLDLNSHSISVKNATQNFNPDKPNATTTTTKETRIEIVIRL